MIARPGLRRVSDLAETGFDVEQTQLPPAFLPTPQPVLDLPLVLLGEIRVRGSDRAGHELVDVVLADPSRERLPEVVVGSALAPEVVDDDSRAVRRVAVLGCQAALLVTPRLTAISAQQTVVT